MSSKKKKGAQAKGAAAADESAPPEEALEMVKCFERVGGVLYERFWSTEPFYLLVQLISFRDSGSPSASEEKKRGPFMVLLESDQPKEESLKWVQNRKSMRAGPLVVVETGNFDALGQALGARR